MEYLLTESQNKLKDLAYSIAVEKIKPVRAEYDEREIFPWPIIKDLVNNGLFGIHIPKEYGGGGESILSVVLITEQLSRICGGIAMAFSVNTFTSSPIIHYGTEEQKQKYLPAIAKGQKITSFSITEKDAGSDLGAIQCTAIKDGDYFILNGEKQWIINAGEAEIYIVVFVTDPERSTRSAAAFIIEKDTPGFTFGPKDNKMGIRASTTRNLIFNDCRVHKNQMLGKIGQGFSIANQAFISAGRPAMSSQALGIAQGALDEAVAYSQQRIQFKQKIGNFQAVQNILADISTQIETARSALYHLCRLIEAGEKNYTKLASMVKVLCSDAAVKATTDAVQVFGGYGYLKEYPVEKMMRDAKVTQIYEGTNQIHRNIIAAEMFKEYSKGNH